MNNIDKKTVDSFGDEWSRFDQYSLSKEEHIFLFEAYFRIFPWDTLPEKAEGFDMGCGSGRWAELVAPKVEKLNCIDPSSDALEVAQKRLKQHSNVEFLNSGVSDMPLMEDSQDFGYSLGVLHHIPDTNLAIKDCIRILKPGAPFLVYLYYRFDNRPFWYALVWKLSDILRRCICKTPAKLKSVLPRVLFVPVFFPQF